MLIKAQVDCTKMQVEADIRLRPRILVIFSTCASILVHMLAPALASILASRALTGISVCLEMQAGAPMTVRTQAKAMLKRRTKQEFQYEYYYKA